MHWDPIHGFQNNPDPANPFKSDVYNNRLSVTKNKIYHIYSNRGHTKHKCMTKRVNLKTQCECGRFHLIATAGLFVSKIHKEPVRKGRGVLSKIRFKGSRLPKTLWCLRVGRLDLWGRGRFWEFNARGMWKINVWDVVMGTGDCRG